MIDNLISDQTKNWIEKELYFEIYEFSNFYEFFYFNNFMNFFEFILNLFKFENFKILFFLYIHANVAICLCVDTRRKMCTPRVAQ